MSGVRWIVPRISTLRVSWIAFIGVIACAAPGDARGQNAANGETLYRFNCQVCHSPDPSTAVPPFNLIMTAANNPGQITFAANTYPSQMGFITYALTASDLADLAAYIATFLGAPVTTVAVEYYYAAWDYYFETAFPDEIAGLDGGAYGGVWKRTGQTFNVWPQANGSASPTCRFFSTTFAPKSSHFYTPFPAECAVVKVNPNWEYESIAFYIALADGNGDCPPGTMPLYRAYNNGMGGAPNHRYMISLAILNQMIAAGWVFEGNLVNKVFACVPQ